VGNRRDLGADLRAVVGDSTVMVTRASSGFGEATFRRLSAAGSETVLVMRSKNRLDSLQREIEAAGGRACAHPADLADMVAVGQLVESIGHCQGNIDMFVNNAGHSIQRSIDISCNRFHDFERSINVNYLGHVLLVLGLLPGMRARRRGRSGSGTHLPSGDKAPSTRRPGTRPHGTPARRRRTWAFRPPSPAQLQIVEGSSAARGEHKDEGEAPAFSRGGIRRISRTIPKEEG